MTLVMKEIIERHRAWYCLDCGKCGAVCPISRWERQSFTSPRLLIEKAIHGPVEEVMEDPLFWSCLVCKRCTELCPSDVHFAEFIRDARQLAQSFDRFGECTHSEMIQTWGRMMINPDLRQNRTAWLEDGLRVSSDSDTVFFVGCLPYYDPMFKKYGFEGVEIARAAIKILNSLGIEPQVLAEERCCGRDQLWEGDVKTFQSLAKLNLQLLKDSGAKRVVSTCPECVRTLKIDYPALVEPHGIEVLHLTEILAQHPLSPTSPSARRVTYQDPCNLGRHLGIYQPPRQILADMGFELIEMGRTKNASVCCGTGCWRGCGQVSKSIQVDRLAEARSTGAELLVTTCLKCQIHFKCAQNDPILKDQIDIPIQDLTTLVADMID
jgi:Fe-S oxidoreductase